MKDMANGKKQLEESDVPYKRRGRPAGKNRVPLSCEERRARNAVYERERRNEMSEVMSQLVEDAGCDPNISNSDLLATVVSRIHRATTSSEDIADLERINTNLETQIATLQMRLGLDDASFELLDNENNDLRVVFPHANSENIASACCNHEDRESRNQMRKRKHSQRPSSEYIQQEKRTKTQSETWSVDSGIELRSPAVSLPESCIQDKLQHAIQTEQQQVPVEITEEHDHDVSQAHIELQTELYNEIYNSGSNYSVESVPEWGFGTLSAQSIACMESLSRSLIVVPSIIPPQHELPNVRLECQMQLESTIEQNVEPPCDTNNENECDFLAQQDNRTPLFLTDSEKGLLMDWIGREFLETSGVDVQPQHRNYP